MADVPETESTQTESPEQRLAAFFAAKPPPIAPAKKPETEPPPESQDIAPEPEQPEAQASEEQATEPEQESEEPLVELEHLGKRYQAPQSLAKAFEENRRMAKQTTMQTAELRRQLETRAQAMQLQTEFQEESKDDFKYLQQIDSAIDERDQYLKANYRDLDTKIFAEKQYEIRMLEDAKSKKKQELDEKFQKFSKKQDELRQNAISKGQEYLRQALPGFSEKHVNEIRTYATSSGYSAEEIDAALDPRVLRDIWKAAQWDALQAQRSGAVSKVQQAPPAPKPGSTSANDSNKVRQYREARANLKKTGSVESAAALILQRMK